MDYISKLLKKRLDELEGKLPDIEEEIERHKSFVKQFEGIKENFIEEIKQLKEYFGE